MPRSRLKSRAKKPPKRVLALPDLEQAKAAVLNSLTSASGQRTYDHAITEFAVILDLDAKIRPRLLKSFEIPSRRSTFPSLRKPRSC